MWILNSRAGHNENSCLAPEELLLSEGVCRQLSIISYHPKVQSFTSAKQAKLPDHV